MLCCHTTQERRSCRRASSKLLRQRRQAEHERRSAASLRAPLPNCKVAQRFVSYFGLRFDPWRILKCLYRVDSFSHVFNPLLQGGFILPLHRGQLVLTSLQQTCAQAHSHTGNGKTLSLRSESSTSTEEPHRQEEPGHDRAAGDYTDSVWGNTPVESSLPG